MNDREQIHFYCFSKLQHWRWMDMEVMKLKVAYWIRLLRTDTIGKYQFAVKDPITHLMQIRDKIKYCIKTGKKGYEVKSYEKLKA